MSYLITRANTNRPPLFLEVVKRTAGRIYVKPYPKFQEAGVNYSWHDGLRGGKGGQYVLPADVRFECATDERSELQRFVRAYEAWEQLRQAVKQADEAHEAALQAASDAYDAALTDLYPRPQPAEAKPE